MECDPIIILTISINTKKRDETRPSQKVFHYEEMRHIMLFSGFEDNAGSCCSHLVSVSIAITDILRVAELSD